MENSHKSLRFEGWWFIDIVNRRGYLNRGDPFYGLPTIATDNKMWFVRSLNCTHHTSLICWDIL